MNFLNGIVNAFGDSIGGQIEQAKSEAQTIAAAVAVWGVIITVELGLLIYFVRKQRGKT